MNITNLKAIYSAEDHPLEIGDFQLPCYVLNNGQRVLSQGGMLKALGLSRGSAGKTGGDRLVQFVHGQRVKTFISNDLIEVIKKPIEFKTQTGNIAYAYDAEVLQKIVRGVAKAYLTGRLQKQQLHIGANAEKLDDAFSKVGLIALIDEATGYQYERENNALQAILKLLISDEILEYQKQFQISFYKEIFRLWSIPFTDQNIKRKPQFVGHLTNKFVYQNMPAGTIVLERLKGKTPKTLSGNYKYRFHQSLTKEAGIEALKKVLYSIEALASVARDKNHFKRLVEEKYGQKEIPFTDLEEAIKKDKQKELSDFDKQLIGNE